MKEPAMNSIDSALRRTAAITVLLAGATFNAAAADPADAPAIPDTPSPNIEPSIPFADHGGIFDWRADGRRGIWLQDPGRNWYYGTFMSPCNGLEFAEAVAFKTSPSGSFDHWSTVIVHNEIPCHLASFTRSEAPPVLATESVKPAVIAPDS
jgi:hypothetical protein